MQKANRKELSGIVEKGKNSKGVQSPEIPNKSPLHDDTLAQLLLFCFGRDWGPSLYSGPS